MNCLAVLLFYLLKIKSEKDLIKIQKVFFLENNFWCDNQERHKTDKGYLYKINFEFEYKNDYTTGINHYSSNCSPLKSTSRGYVVPRYWTIQDNNTSFFDSTEVYNSLLRFSFFFTDEPIDCFCALCCERNKKKMKEYVTYKSPEKKLENCISLRCDGKDIRMEHIKEKFRGVIIIRMKLLKFNEYINLLGKKEELSRISYDVNFDLYYFKNHSECFRNLRNFIKDLCYFKLVEDNVYESSTTKSSELSIDTKTSRKVSQFRQCLWEKFYKNETGENYKPLFNRCYDYIKNEILKNNIFLPIGGKYDVNYYIEHLSNIIYESAKERQKKYATSNFADRYLIFSGISYSLKLRIKRLLLKIVQDLCESEYVPKHFSKVLGRKIETLNDFVEVEKIVCDYYNMFLYIVDVYHKFNKFVPVTYSYCSPIFIDNYNLKIIDGIKIEFKYPNKFVQIKGFDSKGKEIILEKDTDYFIENFSILYFPSEFLKMKNIHEIEIILLDNNEKINKKFKINEFLSVLK